MFPPGIVNLHKVELVAARLLMEDPTNEANNIAFRTAVDARSEAVKEHMHNDPAARAEARAEAHAHAHAEANANAWWKAKAQARKAKDDAEIVEEMKVIRERSRVAMAARIEAREIARLTPATPLKATATP